MNLKQHRLGDYVLAEQLRQDKTGTVYRAVHATSGKPVAVKVLHDKYSQDSGVVGRFRSEAGSLGRLKHPGIVAVLDHGESADGLYIVMESLEGESLAERLERERRLSLAETQRIVGDVAGALAAAHRQRIVHRDLRAEEVFLVGAAGSADRAVKIFDLGLAKILGERATATAGLGGKDVDQRADIHALGQLAYQMLCGQTPPLVSAPDVGAAGAAPARKRPAPLSTQGVTVPAAIEAAIMKALAPKKKRRFSSMAEFAQAFGVTLTPAAPPPPGLDVAPAAAATEPLVRSKPPLAPPSPPASPVPERANTLSGIAAQVRELGRSALERRQVMAVFAAVAAAAFVVVWFAVRSGGPTGPVVVDVNPPRPKKPEATLVVPPSKQPPPPANPGSRVDEILALNEKAVSAYAQSNVKAARSLLEDADKIAVSNGYQDAMVRAQTQVRLGALWMGGQKNPRVGRRYFAKAVAINPAVKLPNEMTSPTIRKALLREKARVSKARAQKPATKGKPSRRHARGSRRTG
jgi:serine/threonine protein kinase